MHSTLIVKKTQLQQNLFLKIVVMTWNNYLLNKKFKIVYQTYIIQNVLITTHFNWLKSTVFGL